MSSDWQCPGELREIAGENVWICLEIILWNLSKNY